MSIKQSVAHGCTRGVRDTSKEARIGSPVGSVGDTMRSDASSRERDGAPVYVEDEPSPWLTHEPSAGWLYWNASVLQSPDS